MLLNDLLPLLQRPHLTKVNERRPYTIRISVLRPGSMGSSPSVEVIAVDEGIDWDQGTLFLRPEETLTALSPDDVLAIRKSVSLGQSWHSFEEFKVQNAKVKLAEARLTWLANEEAMVKHLLTQDGVRYTIRWPNAEEEMADYFLTPEAAIDAARSLEAMEVKST